MKITKIKMKNFRGFFREKSIDFQKKDFVLLSAPNGSGKTSVIDAIEWCLTGNIGRLKGAYDNRSSNNTERKKNLDGILKNKNASAREDVEVELTYTEDDNIFFLLRKQNEDILDKKFSKIYLNGNEVDESELEKYTGKSFYNYHFCDVQKAFEIQSKQRKDLPEMFTEFITDYNAESTVAYNLEVFAEDVSRCIDEQERKKVSEAIIKNKEDERQQLAQNPEILSYPETILYTGEETDIMHMDNEQLNRQIKQLYRCGYSKAVDYLNKLVSDRTFRDNIQQLTNLMTLLKTQKEEIEFGYKYKFYKDDSAIEKISELITEYKAIHLNKENIRGKAQLLLKFDSDLFTEDYYKKSIHEIEQYERDVRSLETDIKQMTEGNVILNSFTKLIEQRAGMLKYHNESKKCPVCGSERFGELSDSQILIEAEEYISKNNDLAARKAIEKVKYQELIRQGYDALIKNADEVLNNQIKKQEKQKRYLEEVKSKTRSYFSLVERLIQAKVIECVADKAPSIDLMKEKITELSRQLLSEDARYTYRTQIQSIFNLLGFETKDEDEKAILLRVQEHAKECPEIIDFHYSLLARKIEAIKGVNNSREYQEMTEQIERYKNRNKKIDQNLAKLNGLYTQAMERAKNIRVLVNELKKAEYDSVGPELKKYFKKLAKIDSINKIQIVFEKDQVSIIDENKKNLVNILSNGQLSIFMLSYFFAGIAKRGKDEKIKVYFIDDLTACMDDVNMLAFLDLLKYQMCNRETIQQIFFTTCDDRICSLLKYKLKGCGIQYYEVDEKILSFQ